MKFAYEVKYHGVYYPAGTEVPIGKTKGDKKSPKVEPGKVDTKEPETEEKVEEKATEEKTRKYSEEELNLPYMKLKSLATSEGFKVDKKAKAEDIKEMLRTL